MRVGRTLAFTLVIASLCYLDGLPSVRGTISQGWADLSSYWAVRELRFTGVDDGIERELAALLPLERSLFWWWLNANTVETQLRLVPAISDAKLSSCDGGEWGCFVIAVIGRQAKFRARLGDSHWLVGEGGAMFLPEGGKTNKGEGVALPLVDGLLEESISPQVTQARASFVFRALEIIEEELGRGVDYGHVNEEGELLVRFPPHGFVALFSGKDGDIEVLRREARRLGAVLRQFRGGEERLERVDLAFQRVAVVKTVN